MSNDKVNYSQFPHPKFWEACDKADAVREYRMATKPARMLVFGKEDVQDNVDNAKRVIHTMIELAHEKKLPSIHLLHDLMDEINEMSRDILRKEVAANGR